MEFWVLHTDIGYVAGISNESDSPMFNAKEVLVCATWEDALRWRKKFGPAPYSDKVFFCNRSYTVEN